MPEDHAASWPTMSIAQAHAMLTAPGQVFEIDEVEIAGRPTKIYKNAPPTLREVFLNALQFGDRDYMIFENERIGFNAHARAAVRLAHTLIDRFGVRPGDRVAIGMRNYPEWSVAFWASILAGAIATPLNSWWTGEELAYGLTDSGAKLAVFDRSVFERVRGHWDALSELTTILTARDDEERNDPQVVPLEEIIGATSAWSGIEALPPPDIALTPETDATIMYTSGTTGRPKGALASHRAIISNFMNSVCCQARALIRQGEAPPEPDPDNPRIVLMSIPFFHATGAFAIMIPSLMIAQKLVLMYKWEPVQAMQLIERERISAVGGVPAIAWQLIEHPARSDYDLSSINVVSYGGAPSAPELVNQIKSSFENASAGNGWGMTETCATATYNFGRDYLHRPDSAGHPPPPVELKIVGPDGQALGPGEVGELWCRGPMNCKGYWRKPDASASTFVDGWVVTGDLAKLDEEGFLYIVDRAKDIVIRGGENVYSVEVENTFFSHPDVVDVAVVGIPHKVLGEEVGAAIFLKPGSSASVEDLQHFAAQHLAAFKVPVEIQLITEPLPRNATGKVLKNEIRTWFKPRA